MKQNVIIVGVFREIIELCELANYNIIGIIDNNIKDNYLGYNILGTDNDINSLFLLFKEIPLIISPDLPLIRKKIVELYSESGFSFISLISPYARISNSAFIGNGVVIQSGVFISSDTKIGNFVKINVNVTVMHDCRIEDNVTIAPCATLLGRSIVGENSYVGACSTITSYTKVIANTIIDTGIKVD